MIEGLDVGSQAWRNLKAWLEEKAGDAQTAINNNNTSNEETRYQRGRRDLAAALLAEMTPEPPTAPARKRARDASGHR